MRIKKTAAKKMSLKLRLILIFLVTALIVWAAAGLFSWQQSREQLDEFFDTYQLLLARQLAAADWGHAGGAVLYDGDDDFDDGDEEDEALGFAVFSAAGQLVFSDGENGPRFRFNPSANGFANARLDGKKDKWRIVWVKTADGRYHVAVGQELEFRHEAALEIAGRALLPWLAGLCVLAAAVILLVSRELKPLKKIAAGLHTRDSHDFTPLDTAALPGEVLPLVQALNSLLQRIEAMLKQERSFISDAAHELKSPLAALRVQAEVAGLTAHNPQKQRAALDKLVIGIDRTARLVEQLLEFSRLEQQGRAPKAPVDLAALIREELDACAALNANRSLAVVFDAAKGPALLNDGYPLMLALLLRNLLDNAYKYGAPGSALHIELKADGLSFTGSGSQFNPVYLPRLGERFFRPPGQAQPGSGLGLSIVKKIAGIHGLKMEISLAEPDMFTVTLKK